MWTSLFVELFGTFVGAGLGLWLAMRHERWKEDEAVRERRLLAITTLLQEIGRTVQSVHVQAVDAPEEPDPDQPFEIDLSYPYLLDAAFTGTIYSGNLALLPADVQTDLSQYYRQLALANALVNRLVTLAPELSAANLSVYRNISTHLASSGAMLEEQGEELLDALRRLKRDNETKNESVEEPA